MIGLLYRIFGHSFDALTAYEQDNADFTDWVNARTAINGKINTLVFTYLQKKRTGELDPDKSFSQQFYLDTINGLLKKHFSSRLVVYKIACKSFVWERQIFKILSVLVTIGQLFARCLLSLNKCRYRFFLSGDASVDQRIVCIGFPNHAFSYAANEENEHPRSFAEFLSGSGNEEHKKLISVDEYQRPSKKYENHEPVPGTLLPLDYVRKKVIIHRKRQTFLQAMALVKKTAKAYVSRIKRGNLFLLVEYFNQSYTERRYVFFFEQLSAQKVTIEKIYVLSFHDIGLLKYGSAYNELLSVFSYSQNLFIPPAKQISKNLLQGTTEYKAGEILEECDLPVFSFYTNNPCGFTDHCFMINYFRSYINQHFGLSLPFTTQKFPGVAVNLGYESFTVVDTSDQEKNILVFDVPTEKRERDLGRSIMGDKTVKNDFMTAFYEEIISLSEKYHCRVILKPKYSLSSPEFPLEYKAMISAVQNRLGEQCMILDPYASIKTSGGPISLSINFPFTSTYYSMSGICMRSIYYVPGNYQEDFSSNVNDQLVLGKDRLENIIKYL